MDSVVHLRIGNQKRSTQVRKSTDCPYFNEYFVFEFNLNLQNLIDKNLTLTVIQPRKFWRPRRILGYFNLDIATIWAEPEHLFYHKWAVITAPPTENKPGPKGYIKIDVGIVTKGDVPHFPETTAEQKDDEIEGNLLVNENALYDRSRANFIFNIYRAEGIPRLKNNAVKKSLLMDSEHLPSTYVQITFAGLTVKTSVRKNSQHPVWNERITITELFPTLCQRIKIELKYVQNVTGITHYIYLTSISNNGENGFLPTFGPSYIHLYSSHASDEDYNGKILIEISTEILTDLMWSSNVIDVRPIRQLPNLNLWRMEPVLAFCAIHGVSLIDKKFKDKPISFELTMGNSTASDSTSSIKDNITDPIKPIPDANQLYWHLPLAGTVPCISFVSIWPDDRTRLYNSIIIEKIYQMMKLDLDELEKLFQPKIYKSSKEKIDSLISETIEKVETSCRIYLLLSKSATALKIPLDEKKLEICRNEISNIEQNIGKIVYENKKKRAFRTLKNILQMLYALIENNQECWPDIFIWMISGTKRVAFHRVPVRSVIFSNVQEENGIQCGVINHIYPKPTNLTKFKLTFGENSAIACKLTVQIWIGLQSDIKECLRIIPNCFETGEVSDKLEVPKKLICNESHNFSCKVYMFQGRFVAGADDSGLSDPFVRVILNGDVLKTKAIQQSIHPVWDQMLIFNNVLLHGSIQFIESNLPVIVMEVFDQDLHITIKNEFIGRCSVTPDVCFTSQITTPPKLRWCKVYNGATDIVGELLMAAVLNLVTDTKLEPVLALPEFINIPPEIKPKMNTFRLDVYFWCLHDLKRLGLHKILKPKIIIECGGATVHSTTIANVSKSLNFSLPYQFVDITIPDDQEYYPPLSIKLFDSRGFGRHIYAGTYLGRLQDYIYVPLTQNQRLELLLEGNKLLTSDSSTASSLAIQEIAKSEEIVVKKENFKSRLQNKIYGGISVLSPFKKKQRPTSQPRMSTEVKKITPDLDTLDWWTRFYLSMQDETSIEVELRASSQKHKIKIYNSELENQPEFGGFQDLLQSFSMYRGKRTGDEVIDAENTVGVFKGAVRVYPWPAEDLVTEAGQPLADGSFQAWPSNEPVAVLVRVYAIRAFNLRPKDISGKSDPYIIVSIRNGMVINDRDRYVPNQINPVFGRCFELTGLLPADNIVKIAVWDRDTSTADDLIGETFIDIESRLYTNHRANCGLACKYYEQGPSMWRDQHKPSQILEILCKRHRIDPPEYFEGFIKVGPCVFVDNLSETGIGAGDDLLRQREALSLVALHRWAEVPLAGRPLVPEHVETRSLFHPASPGLEQGKLQLWVDVFPRTERPVPPAVDVTPQLPQPYELRVIIWNAEEVILDEDDFFVGEKKSDIYIKGWVIEPESSQCTDVHYNSISGEGNFNWRFIFPFNYLASEDRLVLMRKKSVFSSEPTEHKLPARLILQVWDNDTFSADDFLGSLTLSLAKLPRGAKNSKLCSLDILRPNASTVNLFKTKRHKGWWPFRGRFADENKDQLTGKVEVEFQLLTEEEARRSPAGLGRNEPQPLDAPKRPDISFFWFRNPWKSLKFLLFKRFRWKIIKFLLFMILVLMFVVSIYSVPNYSIKRIIGA